MRNFPPFLRPDAGGEGMLPTGNGGFRTLRRARTCHLRRRGAKGGTGHPDLRPGFLSPLLRLPLTFRSAAQRSFAAKKRGQQLRPVRRSFFRRRLGLASRSISAHNSARQRVQVGQMGRSARFLRTAPVGPGALTRPLPLSVFFPLDFSVGRGDPTPPLLTVCTDLQRRHEVMPPYGSSPENRITTI